MRRLREKLAQANLKLGRSYPEPKLSYTQRGTSAGTAWLESYEIRLNPVLLMENSEAFIEEVVPHELAHLLVWKHFGRVAPHGMVRATAQIFPHLRPVPSPLLLSDPIT